MPTPSDGAISSHHSHPALPSPIPGWTASLSTRGGYDQRAPLIAGVLDADVVDGEEPARMPWLVEFPCRWHGGSRLPRVTASGSCRHACLLPSRLLTVRAKATILRGPRRPSRGRRASADRNSYADHRGTRRGWNAEGGGARTDRPRCAAHGCFSVNRPRSETRLCPRAAGVAVCGELRAPGGRGCPPGSPSPCCSLRAPGQPLSRGPKQSRDVSRTSTAARSPGLRWR